MSDEVTSTDHLSTPRGVEFEHRPESGRFAAVRRGSDVAELDYRAADGVWDLLHTWAHPAVRGTGVASDLVTHVMDRAREAGVRIVPSCPYIPVWLSRHQDYADLVDRDE